MLRIAAALLVLTTAAATAQDVGSPLLSTQGTGPAIGFRLGAGVASTPSYFGSGSNEAAPALNGSLSYLRLGGFTFGDPDPLYVQDGFGVNASFRYIRKRDADDHSELDGLDDVDASVELGGGLSYATRAYRVFGNVRYGVVGHHSFVGEIGADAFVRPTDRLTLSLGPRALFGSGNYASTYFGVTADEAAASGGEFSAYDAGGGLVSSGVEFGAGYRISDNWGIDASITYDRLRKDAADSPITRDDKQVSASIGVTRRFTLGF